MRTRSFIGDHVQNEGSQDLLPIGGRTCGSGAGPAMP